MYTRCSVRALPSEMIASSKRAPNSPKPFDLVQKLNYSPHQDLLMYLGNNGPEPEDGWLASNCDE